jgi:hypothetical protein
VGFLVHGRVIREVEPTADKAAVLTGHTFVGQVAVVPQLNKGAADGTFAVCAVANKPLAVEAEARPVAEGTG